MVRTNVRYINLRFRRSNVQSNQTARLFAQVRLTVGLGSIYSQTTLDTPGMDGTSSDK